MSCDSRQYASIFCIHTSVARAGTGTDCPASHCSPRGQDHLSRVFLGFWRHFVAFSGVLKCGWPWHSIFVPQGHVRMPATKHFLAFWEVRSPKMTCLYVQGPWTSMFSCILSLATSCTSYSARETGFCLCPAMLGWQPVDPACKSYCLHSRMDFSNGWTWAKTYHLNSSPNFSKLSGLLASLADTFWAGW